MAEHEELLTVVVRKPNFGLPTGCPICLPVCIYLKFAKTPFHLDFNSIFPDSDQIPYVESGSTYVAYNNENGGVIECLMKDGIVDLDIEFSLVSDWTATKAMALLYQIPYVESGSTYVAYNNENGGVIECLMKDGIVDLDIEFSLVSDWTATKAMANTWLTDALMYELWLGTDGTSASKIYYSDLSWPIGKILLWKKKYTEKLKLGIAKINSEIIEGEIYKKARLAYGALSDRLGEQKFLFNNRPSSLDAMVLAHVLFTLQALPETSVLRSILLEHDKLVNYAEIHKTELLEAGSSSSVPQSSADPSSATRRGPSNWSSKPKTNPKREKTEEEKKFKRRGKFFLGAQVVAVVLFLSYIGGYATGGLEGDEDDNDMYYE